MLRKRVVRFVLLILIFWAIQCVWCLYRQKAGVDFVAYATSLWCPDKVLLGVAQSFETQSFLHIVAEAQVGFYMIFGYEPSVYVKSYIPFISNILLPFVLGYFVEHRVEVLAISWRKIMCVYGVLLFVTLCVCTLTCHVRLHSETLTQEKIQALSWFASCQPLLAAACYVSCKKLFVNKLQGTFAPALLMQLGGAVLTIMIVENVLRYLFSQYFGTYSTSYLPSVYVTLLTRMCWTYFGNDFEANSPHKKDFVSDFSYGA